ncbi:MAG: DNA-3-methyladenine glycosylase [Bernardetiaceae bacterium]|jgi:DNA-3-methyladenine glycosylase II|nr:DNA-3-methyladenine glycosylase [Bernardetiaceae bacterium]
MTIDPAAVKRHLAQDATLKTLVDTIPFPEAKPTQDLYLALLESIVSQQLSVRVADVIWGRVLALFPGNYPEPERVLALPVETLRGVGLSFQKAGYFQNVARYALDNQLAHADLAPVGDEELIARLSQIKGVGRWTVEMLLMFALGRPDIFSVDDLGIRQAIISLYQVEETGKSLKIKLIELSEAWRPYRSYACRYLWRWKDNPPLTGQTPAA